MLLKEFGEKNLIKRIKSILRKAPAIITQEEEDAAIFPFSGKLAISTDMSLIDTDYQTNNPELIGKKSVTSSIADVLSKGALPKYMLTGIGLPKNFAVEFAEKLIKAMDSELKKYNAFLTGGDINHSDQLIISNTVIGKILSKSLLRSGAKTGDYIVITGEIGNASLGYYILKNNLRKEKLFLKAQNEPKIDFGLCKKIMLNANAGIDVSDGLGFELNEIARQSKKKITIFEDKLPINPKLLTYCKEFNLDFKKFVFHSGEDYQIVFSTPNKKFGIVIGKVEDGKGVYLIRKDGKKEKIPYKGWNSLLEE